MHILTETPSPSRWLAAAYLAAAVAVAIPVAKADAPAAELTTLAQDDGDRAEVEKLRKQIAELKKQQAELAKQLAKIKAAETRGREDDGDDDDGGGKAGARAKAKAGDGGFYTVRTRGDDGEEVGGLWTMRFDDVSKAFVVEDGEVRELKFDGGKAPRWVSKLKAGDGGVWVGGEVELDAGDGKPQVFRLGDGEARWRVVTPKAVELEDVTDVVLPDELRGKLEAKLEVVPGLKVPKAVRVKGGDLRVLQLDDVTDGLKEGVRVRLDDVTGEHDGDRGAVRYEIRTEGGKAKEDKGKKPRVMVLRDGEQVDEVEAETTDGIRTFRVKAPKKTVDV